MNRIPCEVYTRVVGFYRPVAQTNKGKQAEINDRKLYDVNEKLKESYDVKTTS